MYANENVLNTYELEAGVASRYKGNQKYVHDFFVRYAQSANLSPDQLRCGIIFRSAVWSNDMVERFLIDFTLHEVGVRGNAWATVQNKLYAVRHLNVRAGERNPLQGKLRLGQLLRALKKFRGPSGKKMPVTRPMLMYIRAVLAEDWSEDDVVLWAAVITAFHLFARSVEYCAKGTFDMDKVLRRASVAFFKGNVQIYTDLHTADFVRVTFPPKTKAGGNETRVLWAMHHELCPVQALATMFQRVPSIKSDAPLFSWSPKSKKRSVGVTYTDVSVLLKKAAVGLGVNPAKVGTHSLRRGGATEYMRAGAAYSEVKFFGRWKSDCAEEYIEVYDSMLKSAAFRVVAGEYNPELQIKQVMPERLVLKERAQREWARIQHQFRSSL